MITKRTLFTVVLCTLICATFVSCSDYDEEDVTIVGFLKINDLLENKLSKTCHSEITQLQDAIETYNANAFMGEFFGMSANMKFDYNIDGITTFENRYTASDGVNLKHKQLEYDITSELWNYLTYIYSDEIPSKAQDIEKGRYYTIAELKAQYPEYKELVIEEFSPMELINTVMREKLFDWSMLSRRRVNLRTLYVYYLANRVSAEESNIDYVAIIKRHFDNNIPSSVNVEDVKTLFHKLTAGEDPMYENNTQGFRSFANDYFETDMFSGEDADY